MSKIQSNEMRELSIDELDAVSGAGEIITGVVNVSYGDSQFAIGISGVGAIGVDFKTGQVCGKPTGGKTTCGKAPA